MHTRADDPSILCAHLAYESKRAYVFPDCTYNLENSPLVSRTHALGRRMDYSPLAMASPHMAAVRLH